jgi:protein-S-isoprenylcysteine O-methyltransferase Ste14
MSSERGGGWVAAQFVIFALIVATWFWGPRVTYWGLVLSALGAALVAWSVRELGSSITPFPKPLPRGKLVETGPYRLLRHPIYVGGFLFFVGLSLAFSAWALLLTAGLGAFWVAKARLEERLLLERFPEYAEYRRRTWF